MDSEELLAQLADIHLPEPISYWPPAPGWWVLAVLLLIAAIWLARSARSALAQKRVKSHAIAEFTRCYTHYSNADSQDLGTLKLRYVNEANAVLKRVALVHFSKDAVAGLGGTQWVDFIRSNGDSSLLDEEIAEALSHGRFRTTIEVNLDQLHEFGLAWINSLYDKPRSEGSKANSSKTAELREVTQ